MMIRQTTALLLAGLLTAGSPFVRAGERLMADSAVPPAALPGINQAESNKDKASKKGEEASGSNSGAESGANVKDADSKSSTTNGSKKHSKTKHKSTP
ncbi:hypothetical protein ACQKP5_26290 [Pseudomonas vancouverensis]|uniref:hypothetical protein n=1 Tax=Pseudomonas vancouverensis TaxID=95300 RepID=UPI003CFBC35E